LPAAHIRTEVEFQAKVSDVVHILMEVLDKNLDAKHPNPISGGGGPRNSLSSRRNVSVAL
jgi:hypothetical protein